MKKSILLSLGLIVLAGGIWLTMQKKTISPIIENVNNTLSSPVVVEYPIENSLITSPVSISGQARGWWFFEASFPITLKDSNNVTLGQGIAQAQGDWMTENYVPFSSIISYTTPATPTGKLILHRDNPSGEPQNDDQFEVLITF